MDNIRVYREWAPKIAESAFIDPSAQIIGRTVIGVDSSIWPLVSVRGDVHYIEIGERSNIQDNSSLHVTQPNKIAPDGYPLIIGDEVTVGHSCTLHACTIGNRCLIGMGSTILDGAVLEDEVFLAAGSLVSPGKKTRGWISMAWLTCGESTQTNRC